MVGSPYFSINSLRKDVDLMSLSEDSLSDSIKDSRLILFTDSGEVITDLEGRCEFSLIEMKNNGLKELSTIYMGMSEGINFFTATWSSDLEVNWRSVDIRDLADKYKDNCAILGMLAQCSSINHWNSHHRYCSNCGGETVRKSLGWRQDCLVCNKQFFPRIDPVVIMLVTCGEYTLLGAGHDFLNQRYSCLAGFVEPGETFELAALRELKEEVGVDADQAQYIFSQPWPFPSTLMIGVKIEVNQKNIQINKKEIKDARWFHIDEINLALDENQDLDFNLPPKYTIANSLLSNWVSHRVN